MTVKSRGPYDLLALLIYYDKGPARFQRLSEEDFEYIFFVAISLRMLFPDERIGRDGKKMVPVFRPKRAKLDEFAFQMRLKSKGQRSGVGVVAVVADRGHSANKFVFICVHSWLASEWSDLLHRNYFNHECTRLRKVTARQARMNTNRCSRDRLVAP